jgi:hypothetical protein
MATKTDRILSYLPGTFRALLPFTGQPSALYAIADAAGRELQLGENKLAQVMLSHWVDTADRNAEEIVDLAKIAALYGLAPQDEEELEEFRRHLKRYIRTFLEGTVTVQGILRVAAEALGLEIADSYEDLDTWWKRATPAEIVTTWDADDAAEHVLGFPYGVDHGQPANPARVQGIPNLAQGVDLQADSVLYLQVDGAETQTVQLIPPGEESHATLEQLVARINSVFEPLIGHSVASVKDNHLVITSPSTGPSSRLEFEEGSGEVGDLILGLPPLTYFGKPAQAALITGTVDLSGDLDLNQTRYLRLSIDGAQPQEVDCGGSTPGHRTVEDVRDDINTVFEMDIASVEEWEDQKYLRLSSPTTGPLSSIAFLQAPAQDAAARLFGPHNPVYLGADEAPAEVFSLEHPPEGVDLSVRHNLRLSIDDSVPITINCAGLRPHETQLTEIANAINAAFSPTIGGEIARRVGRRIRLISPSTGEFSQIRFETPDEADATELIFGLPPRTRRGSAPTSARLVGKKEIDEVNLLARHLLRVRVDGMPAVIVDLRQGVENPRMAILQDLVHALEAQLGDDTATDDGLHLILASPTYGSGSSLEILPLEIVSRQRYVSRAHLTGEAAEAILGVHQAKVFGHAATRARLVGTPDLSRGVDLRSASYLRLSVDGQPFRDIQCAGPRPRATLLDEIVQAINKEWNPILDSEVAFSDGRKLILASPTEGAQSSLRFEPPQVYDALDNLLDLPAGSVRGTAATGVTLIGLPDLSEGVDLPAQAAIKVGLDGSAPIEIPLTGDDPAHLSLVDLVVAISLQLGSGVASQDGQHLIMASSKVGVEAQLELETPDGNDATPALFGFSAPRKYQGNDAKPAVLQGKVNLSGTQDLSLARFLRIGVDGKAPVDVDCAAEDASNTELADIAARINAALKADVAFPEGDFLRLQSPSTGSSSRLLLERYTAGDARTLLLGENVPEETRGEAPKPATLTGTVSLTSPADLSRRSVMRIAVDGGRPFDVDVHGSTPESTLLNEIVTKINDVSPGLASAVEIDQLRLTSPSAGPASSIEVLPLRSIELIEYLPKPPQPDGNLHRQVRHGEAWNVDNPGAGETFTEVSFITPSGAAGPMLVNETIGWRVGLVTTFRPGEGARIWSDLRHGLLAERVDAEGNRSPIPPGEISAAPLGGSALVPFPQEVEKWLLTGSSQGAASLTLDNPLAPRILVLHSFVSTPAQPEISVQVVEAKTSDNGTLPALPGDGSHARTVGRLVWVQGEWLLYQAGEPVARVRNGVAGGLTDFQDRVVAAQGPYFAAEPPESLPLLIVEQVDCLFDVTISDHTGERVESFSGVTIGSPESDSFGLAWKVNAGENSSLLVRADVLEKAGVLRLPRGRSRFRYLDCLVDRFNRCVFGGKNFSGGAHFAGGECRRRSRFNLSRFTYSPPEKEVAVFDSALPYDALPVEVSFSWTSHMPGAMQVRLPADLPSRFGGVFNQARFSRRSTLPELFENAVTEPAPADEPRHIKNLINDETDGSQLVVANVVPDVPIGWTAQMIPFRKPRHLTLGSEETPARIYLQDPDVPVFIELRARSEGDWGNAVSVAMRKSGPAMFDVSVAYNGSRFDSAREAVAGPELPELVLDILKPAPVGVRLAKAAGIHGEVTRGGVEHAI